MNGQSGETIRWRGCYQRATPSSLWNVTPGFKTYVKLADLQIYSARTLAGSSNLWLMKAMCILEAGIKEGIKKNFMSLLYDGIYPFKYNLEA